MYHQDPGRMRRSSRKKHYEGSMSWQNKENKLNVHLEVVPCLDQLRWPLMKKVEMMIKMSQLLTVALPHVA